MNATTFDLSTATFESATVTVCDGDQPAADSKPTPQRVIVRQAGFGTIFAGTSSLEDELLRSVISGRLRL